MTAKSWYKTRTAFCGVPRACLGSTCSPLSRDFKNEVLSGSKNKRLTTINSLCQEKRAGTALGLRYSSLGYKFHSRSGVTDIQLSKSSAGLEGLEKQTRA